MSQHEMYSSWQSCWQDCVPVNPATIHCGMAYSASNLACTIGHSFASMLALCAYHIKPEAAGDRLFLVAGAELEGWQAH